LLQLSADGREYSLREAIDKLSYHFKLSQEETQEMLPSGRQTTFDNRVGWARTYLKKAGLLKTTRRGFFQITARGQSVLSRNPSNINVKYLEQFPEFIEFKNLKRETSDTVNKAETNSQEKTPEENLESIVQALIQELASELLENIKGW